MASSLLARTVARRSLNKALSLTSVARVGGVRYATSYFTPAHEYCQVDGDVATCGITDFAQSALGDIVFVDLPDIDDEFEKGDSFGSVESVKAASDVYAPISGTVVEINEKLMEDPGVVNTDAEGAKGWFVKLKISDPDELADLMTPEAYAEHCAKEAH